MVKVPFGELVEVDLWNEKKKSGMIKYITHTMDLVHADCDFHIKKGDDALVCKTRDNFVKIIPIDRFSRILDRKDMKSIHRKDMNKLISELLKENIDRTGGIQSFDEILTIFQKSTIANVVDAKFLQRAMKKSKHHYDVVEKNDRVYFCLPADINQQDVRSILSYSKKHAFVTPHMIKEDYGWHALRIQRVLDLLIKEDICEVDSNYRTGARYHFKNVFSN